MGEGEVSIWRSTEKTNAAQTYGQLASKDLEGISPF